MTKMTQERTESVDLDMVADYLEQYPNPTIETMKDFAPQKYPQGLWLDFFQEDSWEHKLKIFQKAKKDNNVIIEGLPVLGLRDLYVEDSDQAYELQECNVVSISDTEPYPINRRFKCKTCNTGIEFTMEEFINSGLSKPKINCGCSDQIIVESTNMAKDCVSCQWFKIQERAPDNKYTDVPLTINAMIKGKKLMWHAKFNERVRLIGMIRFRIIRNPRDGGTKFFKWFEVFGVRKLDKDKEDKLTEEEIKYIQSEQAKPGYYDKLLKSFCPKILGEEAMKETAMLAIGSIGLPRPARILWVADPSKGKTDIAKAAVKIAPNAHFVEMNRGTQTGLTVSSEKDEETGKRFVGRGVFTDADKGLLCIDEAQFADAKAFMNLNAVLESGQINFALPGGNHGVMDANPAVIVSCNPQGGRIGDELAVGQLLKFLGNDLAQFLGRMNIVLIMRDNSTAEEERAKVEHMYNNPDNDPESLHKYDDNWFSETEFETVEVKTTIGLAMSFKVPAERFGTKWLKKIIKYTVENVQVEQLPPEYKKDLIDYYMKNWEDTASKVNKLMTKRFVRHGMVLAQYMARLKGYSKPTNEDIKHVIKLLEKTMSVAAFDPQTKTMDTNPYNGNRPQSEIDKLDKEAQFMEGIQKACIEENGQSKGYFTMDELIYCLTAMPNTKWKEDYKIEERVNRMLIAGKLMEPKQGRYQPI